MKAHSNQLLSIVELADKALFDLLESSHRKEQFIHWAIDYYRKYRMDMAREVKTVRLDMTPWKAIVLPKDCVDWILLGIPNGQSIDTFTKKHLAVRDCACEGDEPTEAVYTPEVGSEGYQFYNLTECGEDAGKMYGLAVKDNGLGYLHPNPNQYVDEIQLSTHVPAGTRPYLMYLSTLFDPSRDSVVHPYAEDMIRAGIHYRNLQRKRQAGNRNISPQDIRDAKNELDEEICLLAERRWDLSAEDIMELSRSGFSLSPKR